MAENVLLMKFLVHITGSCMFCYKSARWDSMVLRPHFERSPGKQDVIQWGSLRWFRNAANVSISLPVMPLLHEVHKRKIHAAVA